MADRLGRPTRYRPVGGWRRGEAPKYAPAGIGCPAIEQAVAGLYREQNEESFWTLMSALNYAIQMETRVLVPVRTAPTVHSAPAPWAAHPIPPEKADGLPLWTLQSDKGQTWLPLFTSSAAAQAERSTAGRPMLEKPLLEVFQLALDAKDINGVVLDPWTGSASLDCSLLNGLLCARGDTSDPSEALVSAGYEAACAGDWPTAAENYRKAAEEGSAEGLARLGDCMYRGHGVPRSRANAHKLWTQAAEAGDVRALLALGDECAHTKGGEGKALLYYRRARQAALRQPDIDYTPLVCLRVAQTEARSTAPKQAPALAAEAAHGFAILRREGDPDAPRWLAETERLLAELTAPAPEKQRQTASDVFGWGE